MQRHCGIVGCGSWLRENALTQPATVHDPVNVMGGANRYPSIASYGDDGYRCAQPILRAEHDIGPRLGRRVRGERVGWVERSDTHQLHLMKMMGFAGSTHPTCYPRDLDLGASGHARRTGEAVERRDATLDGGHDGPRTTISGVWTPPVSQYFLACALSDVRVRGRPIQVRVRPQIKNEGDVSCC